MELRRTFNTDEYNYDKSRPAYPKELFEDILIMSNYQEIVMYLKLELAQDKLLCRS